MVARLLLAVLLLLPVPAAAQALAGQSLAGSWALRLDGAIIMRFDLERDGEKWRGGWAKPTHFATDGKLFGKLELPAVERKSDDGRAIGDWAELSFTDPRPGVEPDVFRFHLLGPDRAELIYVGTGLEPYVLERVAAGAPLGPFVAGELYGDGETRPPPPAPAAPTLPPRAQPRPEVQGPPAVVGR
ncbi:MAG TPA: hypothetical protein VEB68_07185 [Croceibacterium sp.]|nr:hypothetical protein [Croceibacterium sp.]